MFAAAVLLPRLRALSEAPTKRELATAALVLGVILASCADLVSAGPTHQPLRNADADGQRSNVKDAPSVLVWWSFILIAVAAIAVVTRIVLAALHTGAAPAAAAQRTQRVATKSRRASVS